MKSHWALRPVKAHGHSVNTLKHVVGVPNEAAYAENGHDFRDPLWVF